MAIRGTVILAPTANRQTQEIGIADRSLTGSHAAARRLLTSLD
jgi:hypothetical protein